MADTNGAAPDPVIEKLTESPFAFDFFRAVRLLENQRTDLPKVGHSVVPSEDPVRFWQNPSLRFAPSSVESVAIRAQDGIPRLAVCFFGLFGPNAPLPPHLTEYALEREMHHHDPTFTAFLNIFHHRLLSLFYRAWSANQKALDMDRPDDQRYAIYLGSFFGLGMDALQNQDAVADRAKLFFTGRLAQQTRNAEGLSAILQEYFQIPAELLPFAGRWFALPSDSLCQLGKDPQTGQLGVNLVMGSNFWDSQLSFRIRFGPMGLADYQRMLPQGDSFARLRAWILNYCGEHFCWSVQLILKKEEVPELRLGDHQGLGWCTWLKTEPFSQDAQDLILSPPS